MSENLKPCPFCGGEARIIEAANGVLAECSNCYSSTGMCWSREQVTIDWNRRAKPAESKSNTEFTCDGCRWLTEKGIRHCKNCARLFGKPDNYCKEIDTLKKQVPLLEAPWEENT